MLALRINSLDVQWIDFMSLSQDSFSRASELNHIEVKDAQDVFSHCETRPCTHYPIVGDDF